MQVPIVKTSLAQLRGERLALKINRRVSDALWNGDAVALQQLALPLLGSGVVDLKNAKLRIGISVGEGVEPSAKQNVLVDTGSRPPA